jgi:YidC/Oxa1 family membrane protein insertase
MSLVLASTSTIWPITHSLRWALVHIHDVTSAPWAWSIILLTFLVRLALVPLTVKQQQSMRRMQALQPEIRKLQEKYRGDRQVLNQKMMELYKDKNVNPFGSCLPIVVQIPVFIGLYYVLRNTAGFVKPGDDLSFLGGFVPDISRHLQQLPTVSLVTLMLIYVGSQIGSTLLMPSTPDPRQKYLFMALPLVFAGFIVTAKFPAGLLLYWITTNLWTVGQAAIIKKYFPPPAVAATAAAPKPSGTGGSKGGTPSTGARAPKRPPAGGGQAGGGRDGGPKGTDRRAGGQKGGRNRRSR